MRGSIGVVVVALLAACTEPNVPRVSSPPSPRSTPRSLSGCHPSRGASGAGTVTLADQAGIGARSSDLFRRSHRAGEVLRALHPLRDRLQCGLRWQLLAVVSRFEDKGLIDSFQITTGTMTLLSDQVAVFDFEHHDEQGAVYFVRNDSPKPLAGCA